MNCPQCHSAIRAHDKYCSQCGCHLETGGLPALPVKDIDKAVEQLEQRLKGKKTVYLPTQGEGVAIFRSGMLLSGLFLAQFILQMIPYSADLSAFLWWADVFIIFGELAIPLFMAYMTPQKSYKITLLATGAIVFLVGFYRVIMPFL